MNKKAEQGRTTRERLISIGLGLFAEHGYEGTSIEAVLRESGLSRGALYHHFDGKDALFAAVLEQVEQDVAAKLAPVVMAAAPDPVAELRAGCLAWIRLVADPVVRRIILIDGPAVLGWHEWRSVEERHGLGLFKIALAEAAEQGRLPAERADLFAHMLMAAMNEVALLVAQAEGDEQSIAEGEAALEDFLGRVLGV
ncbi:TetR/AcrR family transcriptional regulator [Actinomadura barringtoniae]|uniref:TetR/AcrR family transcriptional regulator n=1 Tax=Actinomadura barringtoniae TaxID=1427535 RepID=A0A939PKE7_9ACTN|nr:TetR/AcrR family transcriptional regulator [Actinomadura barringtoniae]MBO2453748.1 TetR/AcrR family transcriptional regulator [Actinomadura barringtoniae]